MTVKLSLLSSSSPSWPRILSSSSPPPLLVARVALPRPCLRDWSRVPSVGARATISLTSSVQSNDAMMRGIMRNLARNPRTHNRHPAMGQKLSVLEVLDASTTTLLPYTFIPLPLASWPRKPLSHFFAYARAYLKQHIKDGITNFIQSFTSKPTLFRRARWRPRPRPTALDAAALHRAYSEALAAGDTNTLGRLALRTLHGRLAAQIASRPRTRARYTWQLLRYTGGGPRVVSDRIVATRPQLTRMPASMPRPLVRQTVVRIPSQQRLVPLIERMGTWAEVADKAVTKELTEYLVLVAPVDEDSWVQGEWRFWGTVAPTTLESWERDSKAADELMKDHLSQYDDVVGEKDASKGGRGGEGVSA